MSHINNKRYFPRGRSRGRSPSVMMRPDDQLRNCSKYWLGTCFIVSFLLFVYLPFLQVNRRKPIAFVWPANQSRDARLHLIPKKSTTILWPRSTCSSSTINNSSQNSQSAIYLLVIVSSALQNFAERQAIRNSWAREASGKRASLPNVRVIFLLGRSSAPISNATISPAYYEIQQNISRESLTYGDILQEDFVDSYANLTLKSLFMLKWFSRECDKIPYLLKTDDDMYINLRSLFAFVESNQKPNVLIGSLICGAVPIKDPTSKWFVPNYMFSEDRYPNYLSGTAYLMSRSAAAVLYEAALDTPIFHLEDIYVTGILAAKVGIRPTDNVGFSYVRRKPSNTCIHKYTISSHHVTASEMASIYERLTRPSLKCPKLKTKHLRNYGPGKCLWKKPKGQKNEKKLIISKKTSSSELKPQ